MNSVKSINNTNVLQPITLDYVEKLSSIKSITNENINYSNKC